MLLIVVADYMRSPLDIGHDRRKAIGATECSKTKECLG